MKFSPIPPSPCLRITLSAFALLVATSCHERNSSSSAPPTPATNFVLLPTVVPATNTPPPHSLSVNPLSTLGPPVPDNSPENRALVEALELDRGGSHDSALEKVSAVIQSNPKNMKALGMRAFIYSELKQWDLARQDDQAILQLDDKSAVAKFNLSEIPFRQKSYTEARAGFIELETDPNLGDLASYKAFLCDLFGGQTDAAQNELDAFNKVGANASYYFANVAWCLVHNQPKEARSWLQSSLRIYPREKIYYYTYSLLDLGYLPIPDDPPDK